MNQVKMLAFFVLSLSEEALNYLWRTAARNIEWLGNGGEASWF